MLKRMNWLENHAVSSISETIKSLPIYKHRYLYYLFLNDVYSLCPSKSMAIANHASITDFMQDWRGVH